MISNRWLEKRKPYWKELEKLLKRANRSGFKSLTRSELRELSLLYRQIAADLAAVREDRGAIRYTGYLNQLLARAHNTIYSAHKASLFAAVREFFSEYPQVFRRNLAYCTAAFLIFAFAAIVGVGVTVYDPDFKVKILSPAMIESIEQHKMWTESIVGIKPQTSSRIMTNNMSVAFMSFASGVTAGLGTIFFMAFNGLLIGVVGTACWAAGMSRDLWSFVAPHGVLELPAIFIAGGAGLRLGAGLLFPGFLPRRESVSQAGNEAVRLVVGTVPMLIVAGVIEAFISPTGLAAGLKFSLAAALFTLLGVYLFWKRDAVPTTGSAA